MSKGIFTPQRIFSETGDKYIYGTAKAGSATSVTDTSNPAQIQPAEMNQGIIGASKDTGSGNQGLSYQEQNTTFFGITSNISRLQQDAIPLYQATLDYFIGDSVRDANFIIYKSLIDNNIGNALTDITKWELIADLSTLKDASETQKGVIEIATQAETNTGTDDLKAITPLKLAIKLSPTILDPVTYGDFNNAIWQTLDPGTYSMLATQAQLSNTPFNKTIDTNYHIFIQAIKYNNGGTDYLRQQYTVQPLTLSTGALFYYRSGVSADIITRGWTGDNYSQAFGYIASETGLSTTVNPGASLNLLTLLTEANGGLRNNTGLLLKYLNGTELVDFLDEINNKFLFPSNLNSFNKQYVDYLFRVSMTVDFAGAGGDTEEYNFRLRRFIDDSIISTSVLPRVELENVTDNQRTITFDSFVNGETDPFVLNGCYIDIFIPTNGRAITFNALSILIKGVT